MRIISGTYRHRRLHEVPGDQTRETKDRVKESIFNSLHNDLQDAVVLDLFAGSGSLGLEALSRGAQSVDFIDNHPEAIATMRANIDELKITSAVDVHQLDARSFIETTTKMYDIILLDPPYALDLLDHIIEIIGAKNRLKPRGIIVTLYGKKTSLKPSKHGIIESKKKTIGITNVSFMKWGESS